MLNYSKELNFLNNGSINHLIDNLDQEIQDTQKKIHLFTALQMCQKITAHIDHFPNQENKTLQLTIRSNNDEPLSVRFNMIDELGHEEYHCFHINSSEYRDFKEIFNYKRVKNLQFELLGEGSNSFKVKLNNEGVAQIFHALVAHNLRVEFQKEVLAFELKESPELSNKMVRSSFKV